MRKYERLRRRAGGLAALLFLLLSSRNLQAQGLPKDQASPKDQALAPWVLGLSRFVQVSPAILASLDGRAVTIGEAAELASRSGEGILDGTIPSLLASALEPLPQRRAKDKDGKPVLIRTVLKQRGQDLRYADIKDGAQALAGLDGLVTGFYSLAGEQIECRIQLFSKGEGEAPSQAENHAPSLSFSGGISELDFLAEKMLPGILTWVAGRELGVVDVRTEPEQGVLLALDGDPPRTRIDLDGSRLFIFEQGEYGIIMNQKGFEDARRLLDSSLGSYSSLLVKMAPIGSEEGLSSGDSIFSAAETLSWGEKFRFLESEKKFSAALGRFVISIPISALAIGGYFSYSEAYSRSAVTSDALSLSGAGALISISISAAFIVDSALKLMDVLRASR